MQHAHSPQEALQVRRVGGQQRARVPHRNHRIIQAEVEEHVVRPERGLRGGGNGWCWNGWKWGGIELCMGWDGWSGRSGVSLNCVWNGWSGGLGAGSLVSSSLAVLHGPPALPLQGAQLELHRPHSMQAARALVRARPGVRCHGPRQAG